MYSFTASQPGEVFNSQRRIAVTRQRLRARLDNDRGELCPYSILEIERGATRAEIRTAYVQKMKEFHPDVNTADTTSQASLVNFAYETLCNSQEAASFSEIGEGWQTKDEFDSPSGVPTVMFVNPFQCFNVNPLEWRALQSVAREQLDPGTALMQNGISFIGNAISYLTPEQMHVIEMELDRMEMTLDFSFCEWMLNDYLIRAQRSTLKL